MPPIADIVLQLPDGGQPLPVSYVHDWRRGETTYRTRHGAFVLSPPFGENPYEHGFAVHVQYGTGNYGGHTWDPRKDEPVFFGIPIHSATVCRPDSMQAARGGRRVADVVYTLAQHWRDLPELARLLHAADVNRAGRNLGELTHRIGIRREQIAADQAELDEWLRLADIQAALHAERTDDREEPE